MNLESPEKANFVSAELESASESTAEKIVQPTREPDLYNSPEVISEYNNRNDAVDAQIASTENEMRTVKNGLDNAREKLGIASTETESESPSIKITEQKLKELHLEKVKESSNYPGDWTILLLERMSDPITKEKFVKTMQDAMAHMKMGEPGPLDKPESFSNYYQDQIDNYDANLARVFNDTGFGEAKSYDKNKSNLGVGNIGGAGTVFSDAVNKNGESLTDRQKNIIEAHEKGHGMRDYTSPLDQANFLGSVDTDVFIDEENKLKEAGGSARFANYLRKPVEIAERMAQLKNYFGFSAQDNFTADHLEHARENYVKDTGLDNNMTSFFKGITPQTKDRFLETINKYPL